MEILNKNWTYLFSLFISIQYNAFSIKTKQANKQKKYQEQFEILLPKLLSKKKKTETNCKLANVKK